MRSRVERLRIAAPSQDGPITEGQYSVFRMDAVMDAWARNIAVQQTQNGITLEDVRIDHTRPHSGAAVPVDF